MTAPREERAKPKRTWYSCVQNGDHPERHVFFHYFQATSNRHLAELCAEDYDSNSGMEAVWPRIVTIYESEDGPALAAYEVEREIEPRYDARDLT